MLKRELENRFVIRRLDQKRRSADAVIFIECVEPVRSHSHIPQQGMPFDTPYFVNWLAARKGVGRTWYPYLKFISGRQRGHCFLVMRRKLIRPVGKIGLDS